MTQITAQNAKLSKLPTNCGIFLNGLQRRKSFHNAPLLIVECFRLIVIYSCLGHIVNLAEVALMAHITKIAAVETSTAIWEYDPTLPDNRVLNGSLDVIAAIWTIAIKVCCFFLKDPVL